MRQILYVSKSVQRADQATLDTILQQSRHNNALDGLTGLLWTDGDRFAQVLEGDERAIGDVMGRIGADGRHHEMAVLQDRRIAERQFGDWSMGLRGSGAEADLYDARMRRALDATSDAIRNVFSSLVSPATA